MTTTISQQVAALHLMTAKQLRGRFAELFGEETRVGNAAWLRKRIAWRLQVQAEGDLSERARQRASELANDADLRLNPPKVLPLPAERTTTQRLPDAPDPRLPPPGTLLTRKYKGQVLQVQVLAQGFEFQGQVYGSLSAVAKAITGSHCNGFAFFNLPNHGANA